MESLPTALAAFLVPSLAMLLITLGTAGLTVTVWRRWRRFLGDSSPPSRRAIWGIGLLAALFVFVLMALGLSLTDTLELTFSSAFRTTPYTNLPAPSNIQVDGDMRQELFLRRLFPPIGLLDAPPDGWQTCYSTTEVCAELKQKYLPGGMAFYSVEQYLSHLLLALLGGVFAARLLHDTQPSTPRSLLATPQQIN